MSRHRDPFGLALQSLRMRARAGVYRPGRPIVILDEARRLGLSTTPVREALAWLCGEGTIERGPTGGYLAPGLDVATTRDRFAFRLCCLTTSLQLTSALSFPGFAGSPSRDDDRTVEDLFRCLIRRTGNPVLFEAFERVGGHLSRLSGAEGRVFRDVEAEAESLLTLEAAAPTPAFEDAITAYHRRRIDAATVLVLEAERYPAKPGQGDRS